MRPEGFPLLENGYDGEPFIYLDSASTTPKPREVIAAVTRSRKPRRKSTSVHATASRR
jgi:selenocysteine lyase/cysteine desulfurase